MRASPRSGRRRSSSEPPRRSGFAKPHVGPVGAGVLAVLAGFPVLAQVGAFPPAEPAQEESASARRNGTGAGRAASSDGRSRGTGFPVRAQPRIFPGIFGGRPPPRRRLLRHRHPRSGSAPTFSPGILGGRPDRRTFEQPAIPSEPGVAPTSRHRRPAIQLGAAPPRHRMAAGADSNRSPGLADAPDFGLRPSRAALRVRQSPGCRHCCRRTRSPAAATANPRLDDKAWAAAPWRASGSGL